VRVTAMQSTGSEGLRTYRDPGVRYPRNLMPRQLPRTVPLAELHCHLGAAVTPAIMWGIAHAQGIKLPT
jgi:hypothetical protein